MPPHVLLRLRLREVPGKTGRFIDAHVPEVVGPSSRRMLVTASPAGVEQFFVSHGVPVTGAEPPTDAVLPPMDEIVRLFASYGCEILGPPLSLSDLS